MAIKSYLGKQGEKLYEVYVAVRAPKGGKYQFRRRGLKTLRSAETTEFELKRKLCDKREKQFYTWDEWHKVFIERIRLEFLPTTVIDYTGQLLKWVTPVWKDRELQTIKATDVHSLIFNSVGNVSPGTRHNILKKLKRIFQAAVDDGLIENNPATPIKVKVPQKKQAVLNASEVDILLQEAKKLGHRFYPIWAVALFTGMRSGELYALKWSDIDFESKRIYVTKSWNNKNGIGPTKSTKNRVVPMSGQLEILFKELKLQKGIQDEHVLPHVEEWTHGDQARVLREFCCQLGITSLKFHDLRATFITQLLLNNVPLAQVMSIVGHAEIKTTNEYLRIVGADLNGATEGLKYSIPQSDIAKVIDLIRR